MTYSPTLFQFTHLLQRVYDKLGQTKGITATGGSTATIVDTTLSTDYQDFSDFEGAAAFIEYDAAGAGAAPEGEYALVTGYASSTKTLSFATGAFTVAPASGDLVLLSMSGGLFPLHDVKRKCNTALRNLGDVVNLNDTTTTAASQTEYTIPSGISYRSVMDVLFQVRTNDSNDNNFARVPFEVVPDSSIGAGDAYIKTQQFNSGHVLRIVSVGPHTQLRNYYDPISLDIHPALAVAACALECSTLNRQASDQQGLTTALQEEFRLELIRHPVKRYNPQIQGMAHYTVYGRYDPGIPSPIT